MKRVICVLLAIAAFAAACTFGGCGDQKTKPVTAPAATESQDVAADYGAVHGGMTGREAVLAALGYVGAGYHCVFYDWRDLRGKDAWYLGLKASDGSDSNVYYVYINEDSCVPDGEIPNIGGENREGSGVFAVDYAGIGEQEAIFQALDAFGGALCVSSEKAEYDGGEYWMIGVRKADDSDNTVYFYYVDKDSCTQKES